MTILANIGPDHRLPIVMKPKDPPQAKCRVKIPCLPASTESTSQANLTLVRVMYRLPHPRPLEVFEGPPKQHVLPLLFRMNASRPVAYIKAIAPIAASKQLVALLTA